MNRIPAKISQDSSRNVRRTLLCLTSGLVSATAAHADVLPAGGSVAAGGASIANTGSTTTITQTTDRAVINWDSFSVGFGHDVNFVQPDVKSATLNRVTGNAPSTIAGQITANGSVYLINPNGIAITETGAVQTAGGFVASTLDIADADFMAGRNSFAGTGSSARVRNAGSIAAGQGAFVALLGGAVSNSGTISVPLGKLAMGSGEQIALDLNGGNFLQVAVPTGLVTGSGALLDNSGSIVVQGGSVQLKAAVVKDAVRNVINMSGSISADSAVGDGGTITLLGGSDTASMAGTVTVTGTLSAQATGAAGNGGFVETSGEKVDLNLARVSTLSASGAAGTWLIDPVDFTVAASGGDQTGAGLSAALAGGNVVILSSSGANGTAGDININDAVSWSANTLTLDAYRNINIGAVMSATGTAGFAGVVGDTALSGIGSSTGQLLIGLSGGTFTGRLDLASTASFSLNGTAYTIISSLGSEGSATGTDLQGINGNLSGNYVLGADIDATATSSWTANAGFVSLGTDGTGTKLNGGSGFTGRFIGLGHEVANLTIGASGNYQGLFGAISGATISNLAVTGAQVAANGQYVGILVGDGSSGSASTLANIDVTGAVTGGTANIGGMAGSISGTLSKVSSAATVNSGGATRVGGLAGLLVGTATDVHATGAVTAASTVGGLFGQVSGGSVTNSYATGAVSLTGSSGGGLVGLALTSGSAPQLTGVYATGNVTANGSANFDGIGGLVGTSSAVINTSHATGTIDVTAAAGITTQYVGGLVGFSSGSVTASNASGSVTVTGTTNTVTINVGGLVGLSNSPINNSYATGAVTASGGSNLGNIGGLVGRSNSPITGSYATGDVNATAYLIGNSVGGLVGHNRSVITLAYATGNVTGDRAVGGLVGANMLNTAVVRSSYATGAVSNTMEDFAGGLVGYNVGLVDASYSTGLVTGTRNFNGGLVGGNVGPGAVSSSYYSSSTSGQSVGIGGYTTDAVTSTPVSDSAGTVLGKTTAQLMQASTFTGWSIDTSGGQALTWRMYEGFTTPLLKAFLTSANVLAGTGVVSTTYTGVIQGVGAGYTATLASNGAAANGSLILGTASAQCTGGDATCRNAGSYTVGVTGLYSTQLGYDLITPATANLVIARAPLTLTYTANSATSIYGNSTAAVSGSVGGAGFVNSETLANLAGGASWSTAVDSLSGVGSYAIAGTGYTSSNYIITDQQAAGNATAYSVTARPITITADAATMLYGAAVPSLTYTVGGLGLVNGDLLTGGLAATGGSSDNVGTYAINQGSLAASANYSLTYVGANLAITPAPLTLTYTANAATSLYGDSAAVVSGTVSGAGFVNGQSVASLGGAAAWATSVGTTTGVGSYAITGSGLTSSNYTISAQQAAGNAAAYSVTARPITVTANALSKVYGAALPSLTYTVGGSGLVNGDTLSGALATTATGSSNVGTYAITQGTVAASSNYSLTYTGANLSVTPAPLTLTYTANAATSIYGNAAAAVSGSVSQSGLVNGDTLAGLGTATWSTPVSTTSGVGSYAVTGSGLSNGNYAITAQQAAGNATAYSVTARPITVTANALSKLYGAALPSLTYTVGGLGLVNGDTLSGAQATSATPSSNVGTYAISQGTLAASGNYSLTYTGANLSVTPAPLTLTYTANAATSVYGNAAATVSGSVTQSGLVNGDTLAGLGAATWSSAVGTTSGVGSYAVTGTGLGSSNYTISAQQAGGNATAYTVTARPITITAAAASKLYGAALPGLTYTVGGSGLVNGDSLSGALATAATASSNAGTYAITQGTLAASGNYAVTYNGANLTVSPVALTLTYAADAATSVYGNAAASLSGTVTPVGLVNGDTLASLGTAIWTAPVSTTSGVGSYAVTGSGLSSGNYAITVQQAAGNATAYTVTVRPITVTANPLSKVYGAALPSLTYTVGGLGLVNGDALTGAQATGATAASGVGTYAISRGTLAASANYSMTYVGGTLTVTPAPLTLTYTANPAEILFGQPLPVLTGTVAATGLVNGDTLAGLGTASWTTPATALSFAGRYAINGGGLSGANYAVVVVQAPGNATALTINPTGQTLTNFIPFSGTGGQAATGVAAGTGVATMPLPGGAEPDPGNSGPCGSQTVADQLRADGRSRIDNAVCSSGSGS